MPWLVCTLAALLAALCLPVVAECAVLRGRVVVLPANAPGAGIWVRVDRLGAAIEGFPAGNAPAEEEHMTAYSDAKGEFVLEHLPPGVYDVAIQEASLARRYTAVGRPKRTVLVSESDRAKVTLEVSTQARLVGSVIREDGLPTRGCRVLLTRRGERGVVLETETDESGRFEAKGLDPGVPVIVEVRAPEGVYRRAETTPLQAGVHEFEMRLPVWSRTARQMVVLDVGIPRVGESPLVLLWRSVPLEALQGFAVEVPLSREGRAELEAPPGVYSVLVRELTLRKRRWESERLFRIEEAKGPIHISVTVQEVVSETAALGNR